MSTDRSSCDPEIGSRLLSVRKTLGLKQVDLANAANISRGMISMIEKSGTKPPFELLFTLYSKFNVNINWVLSGKGVPFGDESKESLIKQILPGVEISDDLLDIIDALQSKRYERELANALDLAKLKWSRIENEMELIKQKEAVK